METKILEWLRAVTLFVLIILGCLHFKSVLLSAMAIDFTKISATQLLSFEWIVPLISFYALFARRQDISRVAALPSWTGFVMTCLFLVALSVSAHANQPPFQLLSIAGMIIAVTHAFWGKEAAKLMWFPMGFLVFAVPIFFYLVYCFRVGHSRHSSCPNPRQRTDLSLKAPHGAGGVSVLTMSMYAGIRMRRRWRLQRRRFCRKGRTWCSIRM